MNNVAALIASVAAIVTSLTYLSRKIVTLVKTMEQLTGLPAKHAELSTQTQINTEALKDLTVQVAHLSQVETARGDK